MVRPSRRAPHRPAGLAPGTLVLPESGPAISIRALRFGPDQLEEHDGVSLDDARALLDGSLLTWIDITGFGDPEQWRALGDLFGLHPLVVEDIAHLGQRPKIEEFGDDLLIFARMTAETMSDGPLALEQLCLLVRDGLVVTFQERHGDAFDPVRKRIRGGGPRLRSRGADYLAYALLDAVVDRFGLLIDDYERALEDFETALLEAPTEIDLEQLYRMRRDLIALRRSAMPMRETLQRLMREDDALVTAETRLFVRDCHDHAVRAIEQIDAGRDLANSLMEVHLSTLGHRTNEAMRTLTVIATLFIPLSFLAGLYGMNFDPSSPWNMPELRWRYGYPFALGLMLATTVGLVLYLRRKGWF